MKVPMQFGFYSVLTEPVRGYEYLTKLLVEYRIAFVQLRIKEGDHKFILQTAEKMLKITSPSSTKLIINDFPEIAKKIGAYGTHVGQEDTPIEDVRTIIGKDGIVGLSTHSPAQTLNACNRDPDYIGIGPVYTTPTKKKADPVIGLKGMNEMLSIATVPAVVIGGIDLFNIRDVLNAGAKNFCMVRQLVKSGDPERILKEIYKIYNEYYPGFY